MKTDDKLSRKGRIMEKILSIKENSNKGYDGYLIITDKQEIELSIQNHQDCCESWGYFISEDDVTEYIGTGLINIEITDTALNEAKMIENKVEKMYEGGIMFVDIKTDRGTLQFVAYNKHNGYYGHKGRVISTQLKHSEIL